MRVEKKKFDKREIEFEKIRNGTVFEMVSNRGKFFIKAGDVYAVDLDDGTVTQPLMDTSNAELYEHLFIYPRASLTVL